MKSKRKEMRIKEHLKEEHGIIDTPKLSFVESLKIGFTDVEDWKLIRITDFILEISLKVLSKIKIKK